jgi:hypothetical protein
MVIDVNDVLFKVDYSWKVAYSSARRLSISFFFSRFSLVLS